jgi:hypothetical protein
MHLSDPIGAVVTNFNCLHMYLFFLSIFSIAAIIGRANDDVFYQVRFEPPSAAPQRIDYCARAFVQHGNTRRLQCPSHSPLESAYLKDFSSFSELRNQNQAVPDVAAPRSKDSPVFIYRHWHRRRCFSIPEMDIPVGFVLRLLRQPEFSHGGCEPKLFKTEFERRFDRPQHAARWQVGRPPYPKEASLRGAVPYIYPPYHVNECAGSSSGKFA